MTWVQAASKHIAIFRGVKKPSKRDIQEAEALLHQANVTRAKVRFTPLEVRINK